MLRRNKSSQRQSGISLIEIVLTTAILSVGILGLIRAFPQGIATTHEQELIVIAGQLAQAKLEEIASLSYAEIIVGDSENKAHVVADSQDKLYLFTRTTTVELVDADLNPTGADIGLKKITITVFWPSVFGTEKSQNVTTLISQR